VDLAGKDGRNLIFYQVWFQMSPLCTFTLTTNDESMFSVVLSLLQYTERALEIILYIFLSQQWPGLMLSTFGLYQVKHCPRQFFFCLVYSLISQTFTHAGRLRKVVNFSVCIFWTWVLHFRFLKWGVKDHESTDWICLVSAVDTNAFVVERLHSLTCIA
jgi:hypothetical protein